MSSLERPILCAADMVRALRDGRKTVTRRVSGLRSVNCERPPVGFVRPPGPVRPADEWFYNGLSYPDRRVHVFQPAGDPAASPRLVRCPYGGVGDALWVRETFAVPPEYDHLPPSQIPDGAPVWYRATDTIDGTGEEWIAVSNGRAAMAENHAVFPDAGVGDPPRWRPSIHMPRRFARIRLRITRVGVERLSDITTDQIAREGLGTMGNDGELDHRGALDDWIELWDGMHGASANASWAARPWVWVVTFAVERCE